MTKRQRPNCEHVTSLSESSNAASAPQRLRPDAQRNATRVLAAARQAFAKTGLDASYHEIAKFADVGVGTVYRRFPERRKLIEAVLLDILSELSDCAEQALGQNDTWAGFAHFFTTLALRTREHSGLSDSIDERGGQSVADARRKLLNRIQRLIDRAQRQGAIRSDLECRDIPFLAKVAAFGTSVLDIPGDAIQAQRCIIVILDGMRAPAGSPLPAHPNPK